MKHCILIFCLSNFCGISQSYAQDTPKDSGGLPQTDTIASLHLPYWKNGINQFSDAYIDTFSVAGNKIRFVNPVATHSTGGNSITLEKLVKGRWTETNLTLEDGIHGSQYLYDEDINGDGYPDLLNYTRFMYAVYFYNPKTKLFVDTPATERVNMDFVVLDKRKHIYCDFQELKGMCNQIHSQLYTFAGFKRVNLFDLTLYNCTPTDNETNLITKLILKKYIDGTGKQTKTVEEIKLKHPIDIDGYDEHGKYPNGTDSYFDYKKFWQARYKKLLGNPTTYK